MRSFSKPLIPLNAAKLLFFSLFHKNLPNYFNKKGVLLPLFKRNTLIYENIYFLYHHYLQNNKSDMNYFFALVHHFLSHDYFFLT